LWISGGLIGADRCSVLWLRAAPLVSSVWHGGVSQYRARAALTEFLQNNFGRCCKTSKVLLVHPAKGRR
jgi:hypothetical protein